MKTVSDFTVLDGHAALTGQQLFHFLPLAVQSPEKRSVGLSPAVVGRRHDSLHTQMDGGDDGVVAKDEGVGAEELKGEVVVAGLDLRPVQIREL